MRRSLCGSFALKTLALSLSRSLLAGTFFGLGRSFAGETLTFGFSGRSFAGKALALSFSRCFLGEALTFRFFPGETLAFRFGSSSGGLPARPFFCLSLRGSFARETLTLGFCCGFLG